MLSKVVYLDEHDLPDDMPPRRVVAHRFVLPDPATIPPRRWLYGRHLIRGFVSATIAPGGVGKTALATVEGLAVATGRPLLGVKPAERAPVWFMQLEDPADEFMRRIAAACLHYEISPDEIAGRVVVTHGRETEIIIGRAARSGVIIDRPLVDAICEQANLHNVGLIIVDPFVGSHAAPENDNGAVNAVVVAWREIAERTGAAVEQIHHSRKSNGTETTVEDGRGASALHGAVRAMRALNVMTEDEAARAGVENRRSFFRVELGKANLAAAQAGAEWHRLESVVLGNGSEDRPSDFVGVATRWHWPDPMEGVSTAILDEVARRLDEADPPYRPTANAERWVGELVADVMGLDAGADRDRAKIATVLAAWFKSGALRKVEGAWRDASRKIRPIVRSVGPTFT